jgi:hypothetical protein
VRELPDVQLVPYDLSSDMHNAFEAVCADRRLTLKTDRATDLIASKIVELAKAGRRGDDLMENALRFFEGSTPEKYQSPL